MSELPPRVLSGVQPTGELHLGNYFGAIRLHIALQDRYPGECFYFIADYHALTTIDQPEVLRQNVFSVAATYLAMGLDVEKAALFRQSDIPEVTELTWLLSCVTGMGLLERAHSYKDKVARGIKPSMGLFNYPILMASDILIYDASLVPVGKDQVQHVEMTQDMAGYFNQTYSPDQPILRRPEVMLSEAPYVPGLDGAKMSKSYDNTIPMFLSGKKLRKLVGKIVTGSTPLGQPLPVEDDKVLALLRLFGPASEVEQVESWYRAGERDGEPFGYGHAKQLLAAKIDAHFAEAREHYAELVAHPERVEQALARSAERARAIARATIDRCRRVCGLQ